MTDKEKLAQWISQTQGEEHMNNTSHWMQACWHFCAFTGLSFWANVFIKLMESYA